MSFDVRQAKDRLSDEFTLTAAGGGEPDGVYADDGDPPPLSVEIIGGQGGNSHVTLTPDERLHAELAAGFTL